MNPCPAAIFAAAMSIAMTVLLPVALAGDAHNVFPEDAVQGWERLRRAAAHLRGRFRYQRTVALEGVQKRDDTFRFDFGTNRNGTFVERTRNGEVKLSAINGEYVFGAMKESADGAFELQLVRRGKQERLTTLTRDVIEKFLFAGFRIVGKSLTEFPESEGFVLKSFVVEPESEAATIEFDYPWRDGRSDTAVTAGRIRLTTAHDWAIESFSCSAYWGRVEGKLRYRPLRDTFIPESLELVSYGTADKSEARDMFELEDAIPIGADDPLPVRLEDYNLAEPEATLTAEHGWNWWLILSNLLIFAILLIVVRAVRRRYAGT